MAKIENAKLVRVTGDGNCGIHCLAHKVKASIDSATADTGYKTGDNEHNGFLTRIAGAWQAFYKDGTVAAATEEGTQAFRDKIKALSYTDVEEKLTPVLRSMLGAAVTQWDDNNAAKAVFIDAKKKSLVKESVDANVRKLSIDRTYIELRPLKALACYVGINAVVEKENYYNELKLDDGDPPDLAIALEAPNQVDTLNLTYNGSHFNYETTEEQKKKIEEDYRKRAILIQTMRSSGGGFGGGGATGLFSGISALFGDIQREVDEFFSQPEMMGLNNGIFGTLGKIVMTIFGIFTGLSKMNPSRDLEGKELAVKDADKFQRLVDTLYLGDKEKGQLLSLWREDKTEDKNKAWLKLTEHLLNRGDAHLQDAQGIMHERFVTANVDITKQVETQKTLKNKADNNKADLGEEFSLETKLKASFALDDIKAVEAKQAKDVETADKPALLKEHKLLTTYYDVYRNSGSRYDYKVIAQAEANIADIKKPLVAVNP